MIKGWRSEQGNTMQEIKEKKKNLIRQSIRFKIFLVSLLPTVALIAAAFLNHQYLTVLGDSAEQILSKNYRSIRAAQETRKSLEEIRNHFLDPVSRDSHHVAVTTRTIENVAFNLNVCRENITEKGELELIDQLYGIHATYHHMVSSLNRVSTRAWTEQQVNQLFGTTAEMIFMIDDLVSINEQAMERAELKTRVLAGQAQRNAALLFGIIILAILSLSYVLSHRIAMPIMALAHQLSKTREGSRVYPKISLKTNDEIGFLATAFNHLFHRLEQYDTHRDNIIAAEKEKVRQSEEAKGKFIADISHQLKTPMTSLSMSIGMLHTRGEKLDPGKQKTLYATAYDDCSRLTALINELVDISRLEAMSVSRPKETLNIKMVIDECLAPLVEQSEKKGVTIEVDIPEGPLEITIDSFRFPWVITNLVGNALRYTSRGGCISLKVIKQGAEYCFQCSDTGDGINPEFLPHIFDRFTQFSKRGKSGTVGLGLAIVKDIIDQHGGDITVRSTVGEGTVFTFWIPDAKENMNEKSTRDR